MLRAFFMAAGGILMFTGVEALVLDHAVLADDSPLVKKVVKNEPAFDEWGFEIERKVLAPSKKTITPPEWAPWTMLSSGAVILLYSIVSRSGGEE